MKKERYVKCDRGYYRWKPTKAMQRAGFHTEAFGKDLDAANQRALELNAQWDQHKKEQKSQSDVIDKSPGTFNALVEDFQRDEVWYHKRAWKTRDDMDRAFKRICGEPLNLGDVKIKYFESD